MLNKIIILPLVSTKNHKINQNNEYHGKKYKFPKKQRKIG